MQRNAKDGLFTKPSSFTIQSFNDIHERKKIKLYTGDWLLRLKIKGNQSNDKFSILHLQLP